MFSTTKLLLSFSCIVLLMKAVDRCNAEECLRQTTTAPSKFKHFSISLTFIWINEANDYDAFREIIV